MSGRLPIVCTARGGHPEVSLRAAFVWYLAADGVERMKLQPDMPQGDIRRSDLDLIMFDNENGRTTFQMTCPRDSCRMSPRKRWSEVFTIADDLRRAGFRVFDVSLLG